MARSIGFGLYLVFVCSWFLHATARWPALGEVRFDLALVILIGLCAAVGRSDSTFPRTNTRVRASLLAVIAWAIFAIPFAQWPGSVLRFGLQQFTKGVVFYFFTASLVSTRRRLAFFLAVFVVCQAVRVVEPTYLHITTGYWGDWAFLANAEFLDRLAGAPSDVINPNGLAYVILTLLCFAHYLGPVTKVGALGYLLILPASIHALALTGSRSGAVGLLVVAAYVWIRSKRKLRVAAALGIAIVLALPLLSANLQDRYRSIIASDTLNSATASGRLEGVKGDLQVAQRRPLFGHGLGTSLEANYNVRGGVTRSHNLYAEVAQELGFIGLAVYLLFLTAVVLAVRKAVIQARLHEGCDPLLERLIRALEVWFATNVVFSLFSYGLSSYNWYLLAALSDVALRAVTPTRDPDSLPTGVIGGLAAQDLVRT